MRYKYCFKRHFFEAKVLLLCPLCLGISRAQWPAIAPVPHQLYDHGKAGIQSRGTQGAGRVCIPASWELSVRGWRTKNNGQWNEPDKSPVRPHHLIKITFLKFTHLLSQI